MAKVKEEHDKLATRLTQILTKFNNGERFTLEELAQDFDVSLRTVERDLKERFTYLPIKKDGKYYSLEEYALGKLSLEDIKNFAALSGIKSLYQDLTNEFLVEILENKINKTFLVKNSGFEDIENKKDYFKKLSLAIQNLQIVTFKYKEKDKKLQPYKLINTNGVWYLCAKDKDKIKTYTLSKIENLNITNEIFKQDLELLKRIEKDEKNWFSKEQKEVKLEILNSAKEYFLRKKVLASFKIIEENEDSFIISTNISFDDEIINLVKYWIPYIKIISPIELKDRLDDVLKSYLSI